MQPDLSTANYRYRNPCTASCTTRVGGGEQRVTQQPRRFAGRSSESGSRGGATGAGLIGKVATKPEGVNSVGARGAEGFRAQIELSELLTFDDVLCYAETRFQHNPSLDEIQTTRSLQPEYARLCCSRPLPSLAIAISR
jgi:hypothetical protein